MDFTAVDQPVGGVQLRITASAYGVRVQYGKSSRFFPRFRLDVEVQAQFLCLSRLDIFRVVGTPLVGGPRSGYEALAVDQGLVVRKGATASLRPWWNFWVIVRDAHDQTDR